VGSRADRPDDPTRVHVAGALPGELVVATLAHRSQHRPQAWAHLEAVTRASPHRRAPACAAFGACGGCVLQHLDYAEQLRWKAARVRALAGAEPAVRDVVVGDCVASPRPLGYRNRSKLVCAPVRGPLAATAGPLALGAYAPRTHDVVDLAVKFEDYGVEAILYTDIGRDGMLTGVNLEATVALARAVKIPVIASGGVATLDDIERLCSVESEGVEAAILGRSLYEGTLDFRAALERADREEAG